MDLSLACVPEIAKRICTPVNDAIVCGGILLECPSLPRPAAVRNQTPERLGVDLDVKHLVL